LHSQSTYLLPTAVQIADNLHLNREPRGRGQPSTHH
jgi:hypothetical protein